MCVESLARSLVCSKWPIGATIMKKVLGALGVEGGGVRTSS